MNVSSVASSTGNTYAAGSESRVKQIQAQIKKLRQELQDIAQSTEDAETKQQKTELMQAQIAQLEAQIQQIQQEKAEQNAQQGQEAGADAQQAASLDKTGVDILAKGNPGSVAGVSPVYVIGLIRPLSTVRRVRRLSARQSLP